jgi:coenzyme PQQ biosynthesis protein B
LRLQATPLPSWPADAASGVGSSPMIVHVLGSAAGGGFPQANCNCRNCRAVRGGSPSLRPRSQTCVAVSRDGSSWMLLGASPDLRHQVTSTPFLHPRPEQGPRSSPIEAVVLTNGEVDGIAGLLSLREGFAFDLLAPNTCSTRSRPAPSSTSWLPLMCAEHL